jgi:hypothetical protein
MGKPRQIESNRSRTSLSPPTEPPLERRRPNVSVHRCANKVMDRSCFGGWPFEQGCVMLLHALDVTPRRGHKPATVRRTPLRLACLDRLGLDRFEQLKHEPGSSDEKYPAASATFLIRARPSSSPQT